MTRTRGSLRCVYICLFNVLLLALTACGGGGGGGDNGIRGDSVIMARVLGTTSVTDFSVTKLSTEPNRQNTLPRNPNGVSEYRTSPHLSTIKANAAYAQGLSGKGVTIGISDDAIDLSHPEFYTKIIDYDQSSFYELGMDGYDMDKSHGTQVTSIAAGAYNRSDNGMMGVAYNANIDIIARPADGFYTDGGWSAIYRYFTERETPVVNISSGLLNTINQIPTGDPPRAPFSDPVNTLTLTDEQIGLLTDFVNGLYPTIIAALRANSKSVFVYAAGNDRSGNGALHPILSSSFAVLFPELQNRVLVVVNADLDGIADNSHRCGVTKAFCLGAPGESILSATNGGGYRRSSGTSLSAPLVSGAIALLMEHFARQSMTSRQVAARLLATANDTFTGYDENEVGQGILDIEAALAATGTTSLIATNGALSPLASTTLTLPAAFGDALQHTSHTLTFFDSLKTAFLTPLTNHLTFRRTLTLDTLLQQPSLTLTNNEQPNPYFALLNQPSLTHTLPTHHENLRIALSAVKPGNNQQQNKWGVSLRYKPTDNLRADIGYSDEGNHMLGSHGSHALAFQPQHTLYGNLNARYALSLDTHLQATAFISQSTSSPQPHSIIRALSPIISTAFDVRLTHRNALNQNDQLRWRVHQPLKVEHGAMTLHYATWRNATQLLYGTQTLDLTPSSRALHFAVDYETPFVAHIPRSTLTLSAAYVKDPNHSRYNKNTWLAAVRLHVPF